MEEYNFAGIVEVSFREEIMVRKVGGKVGKAMEGEEKTAQRGKILE